MRSSEQGHCMQMREEQKVPDAIKCCGSCHEDEGYGYTLCTWQSEDGKVEYDVCCTLANWNPEEGK